MFIHPVLFKPIRWIQCLDESSVNQHSGLEKEPDKWILFQGPPCQSVPQGLLLESNPSCSRNQAFFSYSLIRVSRSRSKQGSKKVLTVYCMPMGQLHRLIYFSPQCDKKGVGIPILWLRKLGLRKVEYLGQSHPGLEPRTIRLQSPRLPVPNPILSPKPSPDIQQLASVSYLLSHPSEPQVSYFCPRFLISFLLQAIGHAICTYSLKQMPNNHSIAKVYRLSPGSPLGTIMFTFTSLG